MAAKPMPRIQRSDLPPALFAHLLDRAFAREVSRADLVQRLHWIETNPTVPTGDWFKRFGRCTVCGKGPLIKTFLKLQQSATGVEV